MVIKEVVAHIVRRDGTTPLPDNSQIAIDITDLLSQFGIRTLLVTILHDIPSSWFLPKQCCEQIHWYTPYDMNFSLEPLSNGCSDVLLCSAASLALDWIMSGMVTFKHISNDYVIKWKPFPRYWPFVRGIHRSPVNSPHEGSLARTLKFLWCGPHKLLNKQSNDWWFETTWRSYDVIVM